MNANTALAIGGAFVASEATGTTNFTGISGGGSGGGGGGGGGGMPEINLPTPPTNAPNWNAINDAISNAVGQQGPTIIDRGLGDSQGGEAFEAMRSAFKTRGDVIDIMSDTREQIDNVRDGQQINDVLDRLRDDLPTGPGGPDPDPTPWPDDPSPDPDPATADDGPGLIERGTGAIQGTIGFAGESGRTIGEAARLLASGEADTSGTLAEDRGNVELFGGRGVHEAAADVPGSAWGFGSDVGESYGERINRAVWGQSDDPLTHGFESDESDEQDRESGSSATDRISRAGESVRDGFREASDGLRSVGGRSGIDRVSSIGGDDDDEEDEIDLSHVQNRERSDDSASTVGFTR